jgi:hypothetical protein
VEPEIQYGALTEDGLCANGVQGPRDDIEVPMVKAPRLVRSSVGRPRFGVPPEHILQLLPVSAGAPAWPHLLRLYAQRSRHHRDRDLFAAGPQRISDCRAGQLVASGGWHKAGRLHDHEPIPGQSRATKTGFEELGAGMYDRVGNK